jgi:hypothetical protein
VLFLTEHHAIEAYWGVEYSSMHSLTSTLDGGEWSASRPGRFTPRETASGTHWIAGWVGPRAVLDAVVKRKIPIPEWLGFALKLATEPSNINIDFPHCI